eukprot:TRINITY_DN8913_c0_g1_i2.p1 TRINITY_DN8913_c0_g1~~TRINITY_DN8913_c0_g1_i2.p1  ORF type:complete len:455 (+),score=116.29 TRINITY_DN8913_c0_g1_i2:1349-2713(+)
MQPGSALSSFLVKTFGLEDKADSHRSSTRTNERPMSFSLEEARRAAEQMPTHLQPAGTEAPPPTARTPTPASARFPESDDDDDDYYTRKGPDEAKLAAEIMSKIHVHLNKQRLLESRPDPSQRVNKYHPRTQEEKKKAQLQQARYNSTSTLFVDSTLTAPDIHQILHCMSIVLQYHIETGAATPTTLTPQQIDVFSEVNHPLTTKRTFETPTVDKIYSFIKAVYTALQSSIETTIISLVYIERFLYSSSLPVTPDNWRRIFLGAYLLSLKVWDENATWNVDFCQLFPKLQVKDMNGLEREFLNVLSFNVTLRASTYAAWYYELRSLSDKTRSTFLRQQPLDEAGARKLELHTPNFGAVTGSPLTTPMPLVPLPPLESSSSQQQYSAAAAAPSAPLSLSTAAAPLSAAAAAPPSGAPTAAPPPGAIKPRARMPPSQLTRMTSDGKLTFHHRAVLN